MRPLTLYKVLSRSGRSCHGGDPPGGAPPGESGGTMERVSMAETIRRAVLDTVDPVVAAAVQEGTLRKDCDEARILIREGLAEPGDYSWLDWTTTGRIVSEILREEIKARGAEDEPEPEQVEGPQAPPPSS